MTFRIPSIDRILFTRASLLVACLTLAACTDADPIAANSCGNKVLEPAAGEDCDGEANCRLPEQENSCRFHCERDVTACPAGFGCGIDNVCRRAAGSYSVVDLQVTSPTVHLQVADLDGDKRQDVVRTSVDKTFVHFFDSGVETAKINSVLKPPTIPGLGDLTGDGRADMSFAEDVGIKFGSGLAVFRSQSDRTFKGTTYSSLPLDGQSARGVKVRAVSPFVDDEAVVMVEDRIIGFGADASIAPLWQGVPFNATELTGMLAGNFDERPMVGPCDELAFALGGDSEVGLFHICALNNGDYDWDRHVMGSPTVRSISLPAGVTVWDFPDDGDGELDGDLAFENQSLLSADFNNDGHLDLAIVTYDEAVEQDPNAENPALYVAFGLGDGSFHSDPSLPLPMTGDNTAGKVELDADESDECDGVVDVPLAFADFNGDGFQDVVSEEVLMVSNGGFNEWRETQCQTDWRSAVVVDLNGDGTLDVAAARSEDPGIEFFSSAGDGTFAKSVIPTKQPAALLQHGDFDGDLITDLVYVELGDSVADWEEFGDTSTLDAQVFVAYGRSAQPPETPVLVGELEFVEGLLTGRFEGGDSTSDVVIASRPLDLSTNNALGLAFIGGNASRQLHAPYLFPVAPEWPAGMGTKTLRTEVAWAVHGRFDGDDRGMAVFTEDEGPNNMTLPPSYRTWRLSSDERGKFSQSQSETFKAKRITGLNCEDCVVAVVDLDADGLDELVTFQDNEVNIYDSLDGVIEFREKLETELGFVTIWDDDFADTPTVRDVDLDGNPDVSLVLDGGGVLVIWGDGSGELNLGGATTIPAGTLGLVSDIAFLNADADPELEMVAVGALMLPTIVQLDVATRSFESLDTATEIIPLQEDIFVSGEVVTAGDFDGDGVDDIAIGDYVEYAILRGERVRP